MSSDLVNIAKADRLHEPGYRYKREQIRVVHENFKGAVTRLVNLQSIAKQLQISKDDLEHGLIKYVKKKWGISTCAPLTFPGHRSAADFDGILQKMIEKYVLCPVCLLPEWNRRQCRACGHCVETKVESHDHERSEKSEQHEKHNQRIESMCALSEPVAEEPWIKDLSQEMSRLYDLRLKAKLGGESHEQYDVLLDKCWRLSSQDHWRHFKQKYLNEIQSVK